MWSGRVKAAWARNLALRQELPSSQLPHSGHHLGSRSSFYWHQEDEGYSLLQYNIRRKFLPRCLSVRCSDWIDFWQHVGGE